MADQAALKQKLSALSKRDDNKICCDCDNPRPQWASLSFAIFICLQCAGQHRGYGVHISFVRSISMDTWQEEQVRRMELGGNAAFKSFMQSYSPTEQGGYTNGMSKYDQYHCWAAAQYRAKLDAELAGNAWAPSAPPDNFQSPSSRTASPQLGSSSTQGLRKSRTSTRQGTGSSLRGSSNSPAPQYNSYGSNGGSPRVGSPDSASFDQKSANEAYFSSLGQANSQRSADLPPSQGGKYQGFGNTPSPPPSSQHPAFSLSSANAPTLSDIQENPMAALGKGWSLFSAAVAGATKVVSENVIQPGMEKVRDPNLHASVAGYLTEAQKKAQEVGKTANQWGKSQLGVDVGSTVGGAIGSVRERVGVSGGPRTDGYGAVPSEWDGDGTYRDEDGDEDFFDKFGGQPRNEGPTMNPSTAPAPAAHNVAAAAPAQKKADGWDDWNDF